MYDLMQAVEGFFSTLLHGLALCAENERHLFAHRIQGTATDEVPCISLLKPTSLAWLTYRHAASPSHKAVSGHLLYLPAVDSTY